MKLDTIMTWKTYKYFCDGCGMDLSLNGCICDPEYKKGML